MPECMRRSCGVVTEGAHSAVLEEIGPRLRVRQIIIYTAIVFYRRFYQTCVGCTPHADRVCVGRSLDDLHGVCVPPARAS